MAKMMIGLYHFIEDIDGEKIPWLHLIPYKVAEKIKLFLLKWIE